MAKDLLLRRLPTGNESAYAKQACRRTITRLRQRRMHGTSPDRFPLHPASLPQQSRQAPVSLGELLDELFGPESGPDVTAAKPVPDRPGPEDVSVGPLPRARALAESLAAKATDAVPPIAAPPVSAPWRSDARTSWKGIRRWGKPLRTEDLGPDDRRDLRALLSKELRAGAMEVCTREEQVRLITPIFIVRRDGKLRLVHDLRPLNSRLKPATVKYASVRDALARRHRFAAKLDLHAAFKHVAVDEELASMMCFQVDGVVFRWTRLPFGMSWSPTFFANALAPTIDRLRSTGMHIVVYVDDVYIGAESVEALDDAMHRTISALTADGWRIAPDKTFPFACTKIVFLGLLVDLTDSSLRVPLGKAQKLARMAKEARSKPRVPLHLLQRITGLLAFFILAVPQVGLGWRGMLGAQAEAERLPGRHVWRRGTLEAELHFWECNAERLPTMSTRTADGAGVNVVTDASSDGTGAVWWPTSSEAPDLDQWARGELDTDSTGNKHINVASFELSEEEGDEASATRELLALEKWLATMVRCEDEGREVLAGRAGGEKFPNSSAAKNPPQSDVGPTVSSAATSSLPFPSDRTPSSTLPTRPSLFVVAGPSPCHCIRCITGTRRSPAPITVYWTSDSTAAVAALEKWRSGSVRVTSVLINLFALCCDHNIVIVPTWVSRELGWLPAADWLSRVVGRRRQAEYTMPDDALRAACTAFRAEPVLDVYASLSNRRFKRYRSAYPEPGSEGSALAGPWRASCAYAFPPYSQLHALLEHFRSGRAGATALVLVAPRWHPAIAANHGLIRARQQIDADTRLLQHDLTPTTGPPPAELAFLMLTRHP